MSRGWWCVIVRKMERNQLSKWVPQVTKHTLYTYNYNYSGTVKVHYDSALIKVNINSIKDIIGNFERNEFTLSTKLN